MKRRDLSEKKNQTLSLQNISHENYVDEAKQEIPFMPIKQYEYTLSGKKGFGIIKADIVHKYALFPLFSTTIAILVVDFY